jgi:hypothetical protein
MRLAEWFLAFVVLYPVATAAWWMAGGLLYAWLEPSGEVTEPEGGWPGVSILIPAYNEELVIARCVRAALSVDYPRFEVLVLDDGSTDRTAEVAHANGAEVLSFGENRGLVAGIAAGYGWAAEHGYRFCGRVDADGQHPPHELRKLLELVRSDACDVAVGSRFVSGEGYPEYRYEASGARQLGHFVLRRAMRWRLGNPMQDATSGMYAVNERALGLLSDPYVCEAPEVEALMRITDAKLRLVEVPVHMRQREHGESSFRGRRAVELVVGIGLTLFAGALARRRYQRRQQKSGLRRALHG